MESNSLGAGWHDNMERPVSKPMQSVAPVQQQETSCYGYSVVGVNTNNAFGVGWQRPGSAQLNQVQDNFNTADDIHERSTSVLDTSTLFITTEASRANQSANIGAQDSDNVFTSGMNWPQPFSSTGELRNFNQTTVMNNISCDSIGGRVLSSRSQSFPSLPSYQSQESMHSMTPILEFSGSGNANTMQGVVSNHGLDSVDGDMSKHVGAAIQRLDADLNQYSKREDGSNYAVPPDIPRIKRPRELAVSDEVQKDIRSDSKKRKVEKKQKNVIVVDKKQLEEISAEILYVNSVDLAKSSFNRKKCGGIPRPRNAFLIFSNWIRERFQFSGGTDVGELSQSDLCMFFGIIWEKLDDDRKAVFIAAAEFEKNEHQNSFSDYKYHPRRRGAAISGSTSFTPASKSIGPLKITVVKKQAGIPSSAVGKGEAATRTSAVNEESIQLINSPLWGKLAELCCIEDGLTSNCKERILETAINKLEKFKAIAVSYRDTNGL